jgi:hypothetical protein
MNLQVQIKSANPRVRTTAVKLQVQIKIVNPGVRIKSTGLLKLVPFSNSLEKQVLVGLILPTKCFMYGEEPNLGILL